VVIINVPVSNILKKHLKKSGLLVLDAHLHPLDILLTARHLHKNYNTNITMAIVGYAFHIPIMKQVVNWFGRTYKINFLPVYKKEELSPKAWTLKFFCSFYPKELDLETRHNANRRFVQLTTELCQKPNQVVIIAPYGSTVLFGKNVRNGVKKILLDSYRYSASITRWHFPKMRFKTHFGKISYFKPSFDREKIEVKIQKEFFHLPLPIWLHLIKSKLFRSKAFLKIHASRS